MNTELSLEEWRDVIGYEGLYQVSSHGRIRSFWSRDGKSITAQPKVLKGSGAPNWYRSVQLCSPKREYIEQRGVHTLVAEVFIGPPPSSIHLVNHIDENKANNLPVNLEWTTPLGNARHSIDKFTRGENHHSAKLTPEQVIEISVTKGTQRDVALMFGISQYVVWAIRHRKIWKHLFREKLDPNKTEVHSVENTNGYGNC